MWFLAARLTWWYNHDSKKGENIRFRFSSGYS